MTSDALNQLLQTWAAATELSPTEATAIRNQIVTTAPSRQPLSASWWRECLRIPEAVFQIGDWRRMVAWTKS